MKTLADLIAFNIAHADEELIPPFYTDQSECAFSVSACLLPADAMTRFISSENTTVNQAFFDAVAADKDLGATRGIDATLKAFNLDALLLPSAVAPGPAAIAGYPIISGEQYASTRNEQHMLTLSSQCPLASFRRTQHSHQLSRRARAARTSPSELHSWEPLSANST